MPNIFIEYKKSDSIITYKIHELYIFALLWILSFALGFTVTKVIRNLLKPKPNKNQNQNQINRGGALDNLNAEDLIAANAIIACVADGNNYLVKDPRLIQLIFSMLKENIRDTSLVVAPSSIRIIANQIIIRTNSQHVLFKLRNVIVYSPRLLQDLGQKLIAFCFSGTLAGHLVASVYTLGGYVILGFIYLILFILIDNCVYDCRDYVQELPSYHEPLQVYSHSKKGHLVITDKNSDSVEVYVPSFEPNKQAFLIDHSKCKEETTITITSNENTIKTTPSNQCLKVTQTNTDFKRVRPKAKQVNFSDFRKTDPVLAQYNNVKETYVPQNPCQLKKLKEEIREEVIRLQNLEQPLK